MANLEQSTEHIDDMQNLNSINSGEVALDNASLIVNEFPESDERKVVKTNKYIDKHGRTMIKNVYDDGSWSTSYAGIEDRYDYTEYYPNNHKKFEYSSAPYEGSHYAIYNKDGKLIYWEHNRGIEETNRIVDKLEDDNYYRYDEKGYLENNFNKYDGKERIIKDKVHNIEYEYNDIEKKVIMIYNVYNSTAKRVVVYKMAGNGYIDYNRVLSDKFVGETGAEIDLKKGGLDNLIKNMGMEHIPHIYDYRYGYGKISQHYGL